jgi:hypothetical protein
VLIWRSQSLDLEEAAKMYEQVDEVWQRANDEEKPKLSQAILRKACVRGGKIIAAQPLPAMYHLLEVARQAELSRFEFRCGSDGRRSGI